MGHLLTALALSLTTGLAPAAAPTTAVPTFAAMTWGAPAADVVRAATAAGLALVARDSEGDYEFSGKVFGAPAVVYAFLSPESGLVKVQIRLEAPESTPRQKFAEVFAALSTQFGNTEQLALFKAPYKDGDGREDEAISLGHGLLISSWGDDQQPGQAAVVLRATRQVVGLDYESHAWSFELNRRKSETTSTVDRSPRVAE